MIKLIEKYFDRLFPLNRSLTGKDYQKSIDILNEIIPIKKINFKSGQKVFDWKIPLEWNVKKAYLKDKRGKKIIDFEKNNLHLLGYSQKFIKKVSLSVLKKNLYFIKDLPNAIPYVTSYYKKRWGFCLSYNQFKKLKNEKYDVVIDTSSKKGKLTVGECLIKGKSKKEILISTNLCHPSLANNELSGPLTVAFLYKKIKKMNLKYSVRFIFTPETIGTIALLSRYKNRFKENIIGGYQVTCCGLNQYPFYKKSKTGSSLSDLAIIDTLKNITHKTLEYFPLGSDECRYNTLGINIPIGAFMRTNFDTYKEYHSSFDNKKIISFKKINENTKILTSAINFMNSSNFYKSIIQDCEPFLSKRNIYSSVSKYNSFSKIDKISESFFWLMSYSNGKTSDIEISRMSKISLNNINSAAQILIKKKLLKNVT
tara:strand:+ start:2549 stop:3826 length:1278 start_codon:yes stop_codon:yes gene_type:complete